MEYYLKNTCANHVTKIKIPTQLERVALTEVCLLFNWIAVVDGGLKLNYI
jgi:hypothetical protein